MAEYLWMLTRKIICGQLINIAVSIRTISMFLTIIVVYLP